jgi:hypothetical protein
VSLRSHFGLLACSLAAACASRAPAPQLRAAHAAGLAQPVVAAPLVPDPLAPRGKIDPQSAALLDSGELIVGSARGLAAVLPDGSGQRAIGLGPALHPRRFGREHVIALQPLAAGGFSSGAVLVLIALADGARTELARLPPFQCGEARQPQRLEVQDPSDFTLDPVKAVACLGLMDGGWNLASLRLRARVDLRGRQLARWLVVGESACTPPTDVQLGDPVPDGSCWGTPPLEHARADRIGFPFTFEEEQIRMPAALRGGVKRRLPGYQLELVSPSRRWYVLAGDYSQRDNAYRRLLLFDRNLGKLYPVVGRSGAWPSPLTAAGGKYAVPIRQAEPFPGEIDLRWLGAAESNELLVVGSLVLRPGLAAFDLADGELAR